MTLLESDPVTTAAGAAAWRAVCHVSDLVPDRGAAALVDGVSVALFRLGAVADLDAPEEVLAIDDVDPRMGAAVLARGLVGSVGERPVVASPLHQERYDLRTGECLDNPALAVRVWPTRVVGGVVEIAAA